MDYIEGEQYFSDVHSLEDVSCFIRGGESKDLCHYYVMIGIHPFIYHDIRLFITELSEPYDQDICNSDKTLYL